MTPLDVRKPACGIHGWWIARFSSIRGAVLEKNVVEASQLQEELLHLICR